MNRKLLVNDQLDWSAISQTDNETILKAVEKQLEKFQSIRRQKTLTKKQRLKTKNTARVDPPKVEVLMKKHILIGINSITKELEINPQNVRFLLVCKSCKPILTRHLYIMCSQSNVIGGCVQDLSTRLSKIFNLKTVSAFAICKQTSFGETEYEASVVEEVEKVMAKLSCQITQIMPMIKKPFSILPDLNKVIEEEVKTKLENMDTAEPVIIQSIEKESVKEEEHIEMDTENGEIETFGSDFISVEKENEKVSDFEFGCKFILFNDNYDEYQSRQINESMTRKLAHTNYIFNNEYKLNSMSIRYRPTDKNRPKINKSSSNKKKLLKNLEKNKSKAEKK